MISIFDMKTLKKKSTVKCTSTPLEKNPHNLPSPFDPRSNPFIELCTETKIQISHSWDLTVP